MERESTLPDCAFRYYRLDVEKGLETVELDEWHTQGSFRLKLGRCIGRLRSKKSAQAGNGDVLSASKKRRNQAPVISSGAGERISPEARIPQWLRPKNRTLEAIREHTETYLARADVTDWLEDCARRLVQSRTQRADNDPKRWAKVCASICYQCRVIGCKRGSDKYTEHHDLKKHLTDKHKDIYSNRREDAGVLDAMLDDCKIEIH